MTRLEYELIRQDVSDTKAAAVVDKVSSTIGAWKKRKSAPSLPDSITLCQHLGIEDVTTLLDEVDAQGNLIEQPVTA